MKKSKLGLFVFALALALIPVSAQSTAHSVALSWAAPQTSLTLTGYNVYRIAGSCPASPSITAFTKLNTTPLTGIAFTDTTVTAGSIYCYTVTALTAGGESGSAGTLQVTIPIFTASSVSPPPSNFAAQAQ